LKSALHFYSHFKFPSLDVSSWNEKQTLSTNDILMCGECLTDRKAQFDLHNNFLETTKPLRTFDPFGGVGAFGLGLEEAGCIKVTHAVEISPSASETMR
jgi:DNA (cytosine-5)-methyltransferase 1